MFAYAEFLAQCSLAGLVVASVQSRQRVPLRELVAMSRLH